MLARRNQVSISSYIFSFLDRISIIIPRGNNRLLSSKDIAFFFIVVVSLVRYADTRDQ